MRAKRGTESVVVIESIKNDPIELHENPAALEPEEAKEKK